MLKTEGVCSISVSASQESLVLQKGFCSSVRLVPGHVMGLVMVSAAGPTSCFSVKLLVFQLASRYFSGNLMLVLLP